MNALFADVFAEPAQYADHPPGDEYARDVLARSDTILLVAEADGAPVGALAAYVLPKFEQARSEIYIYDLAVCARWRRMGVASRLIEETRRIGREIGAWTVFVQADTAAEDEPARLLYRKLACDEIAALHFDITP